MPNRFAATPQRCSKADLAKRLAAIRNDLFGEQGHTELARLLEIPVQTLRNYESGVTIPGEVLLRFLELAAVEPAWLMWGEGPRYRATRWSEPERHWN